ncbi:MAG: ABC transporter permease subunit [Lachnospiraceae bacterium]|nr:ABC transporter permease subunit [Lachnospiraceae bacterium]MCI9357409.1 ABC transporter permease subunit [Lachnospiraceae bacterium]
MILFKHELRQGRNTLLIWSGVIAFMLGICIFIYPEMKDQMGDISGVFADMGGFSAAFGMDQLNFGEFIGFFGVECGNVLGLGGAFFAALLGISALAKEEKEQTAEFLLTHPVTRENVVLHKLCAVLAQIAILNLLAICITAVSILMIKESPEAKTLAWLFLAYFILQIETASICFGMSAFISQGGLGIGLGMAALFYFLNIIANLTEQAEFLKYITPFGYTEGADIIAKGSIDVKYLSVGLVLTAVGIAAAFYWYCRKDIV